MDFVKIRLRKMHLWPVEHFFLRFFQISTWSEKTPGKKCSTGQRCIFPKWLLIKSIFYPDQVKKSKFRVLRWLSEDINLTLDLSTQLVIWQSICNECFAWFLEIIYIVYFRQDSGCSDSEVPYVSYTISKPIGDSPKKGSKPQQSSKYKFSNPMLSQR